MVKTRKFSRKSAFSWWKFPGLSFPVSWFSTRKCATLHSVEKQKNRCHANYFSSNQFRVKFFLRKKLLSRNFCEKMVAVKFCYFHTVHHEQCWKLKNSLSLNFFFVKSTTYLVFFAFSRNFCLKSVGENFRNFHTVRYCGNKKRDHDFYINIFSVKSTSLLKKLPKSWFHEFF